MNRLSPKIYTVIAGIIAFVFLGVAVFGVMHSGMQMDRDGQMSNCPLGVGVVCQMNFSEHISTWQSVFVATLQTSDLAKILNNILLVGLTFFIGYYSILFLSKRISYLSRQYIKETFYVFSPMQEAFAQGILNPKTF